jgi:hypothetical protein
MRTIFVCISLLVILFTKRVEAAVIRFGLDESINKIQDVSFKGSENEDLYLGHLTGILCIGAGVCLIDKGYVLGIKSGSRGYYPLTQETIKSLQVRNLLPTPLPKYHISFIDYLFGYSLWIILAGAFVYYALRAYYERKKPYTYTNASTRTNTTQKMIVTKEMQEYFLRNFPPTKLSHQKKK